jgi:hypothetical protein
VSTETRTEADMLGAGFARITGVVSKRLADRIKALEFALDTAIEPHNARCSTRKWDTCDCGLRALMEADPFSPVALQSQEAGE